MQLVIPRGSKIHKLFMWCLGLMEAWGLDSYAEVYKNGTNLCHLVRVLVVYTPLVFLTQPIFLAAPVIALVAFPLWLFGPAGWIHTLEIVLIAGAIVGSIFLMSYLANRYGKGKEEDYTSTETRRVTMLTLAVHWIIAKKSKICPLVEWNNQ